VDYFCNGWAFVVSRSAEFDLKNEIRAEHVDETDCCKSKPNQSDWHAPKYLHRCTRSPMQQSSWSIVIGDGRNTSCGLTEKEVCFDFVRKAIFFAASFLAKFHKLNTSCPGFVTNTSLWVKRDTSCIHASIDAIATKEMKGWEVEIQNTFKRSEKLTATSFLGGVNTSKGNSEKGRNTNTHTERWRKLATIRRTHKLTYLFNVDMRFWNDGCKSHYAPYMGKPTLSFQT